MSTAKNIYWINLDKRIHIRKVHEQTRKIFKFICAGDKPYAQHGIASALGEDSDSVGVAFDKIKKLAS